MCAIIAGHFVGQSGTIEYHHSINDFFLLLISGGGRIAVNVFLLIGVWYMNDAKISGARILKMYGQLYLFSVMFTVIALIIDYRQVSLKNLIYGFMPFIGRALWFASSYLCLLIFKPFLDMILQWKKKQLISFTVIFFIFMTGLSTILATEEGFLIDTIWFAAVYLVIGTLKRYPPALNWKGIYSLILSGGGYIILVTAKFLVATNQGNNILFQAISRVCKIYGSDIKSFPNILLACLIFHFFITMKPRKNEVINRIAKGTFSVYIIHQVPAFYPLLWPTFFNSDAWLSEHNILYVLFVVVAVFAVCSIIDIPRRKWFEPAFVKTKLFDFITSKIEKIYN